MSINVGTKEEKGWVPLGQPSNCLGWSMGGVGSAPLHVVLRNKKGGGLHGNSPPSLETGELYNFTRQYCFFTTNGFLVPPVYLSRIDPAC